MFILRSHKLFLTEKTLVSVLLLKIFFLRKVENNLAQIFKLFMINDLILLKIVLVIYTHFLRFWRDMLCSILTLESNFFKSKSWNKLQIVCFLWQKAFLKHWFAINKKGEIVSSNTLQKPSHGLNYIEL